MKLKIAMIIFFAAAPARAAVFWEDDFENHLWIGSNGNPWDTSGCGSGSYPDGCSGLNPGLSTHLAHSGTHSLESLYQDTCGLTQVNPNAQGCGAGFFRSVTPTNDLYMRWWTYFPALPITQIWDQSTGSKQMYYRWAESNLIWHIYPGENTLMTEIAHNYNLICQNFGGTGYPTGDVTCDYFHNKANVPLNDGQWHCVETHVYGGTPGNADGLVESWVDGTLILQYINIPVFQPGGTSVFTGIEHYEQMGGNVRYIDDLAVGDTRIGCGTTTPPGTLPPAAPSGLKLR